MSPDVPVALIMTSDPCRVDLVSFASFRGAETCDARFVGRVDHRLHVAPRARENRGRFASDRDGSCG